MTKTLCLKMQQFTKIMIRGLLVKLLSSYFGVEVPPEYVLGEGSDQEEETPLPPSDQERASREPEGSRTDPAVVLEPEASQARASGSGTSSLVLPTLEEQLLITPRYRRGMPIQEQLLRSYEFTRWVRGIMEASASRSGPVPSEPNEASQARASGSGTSSLVPEVPVVPEEVLPPTPPRSCGSKRPRENSDPSFSDEEV
jgi:hypothetical protein